MKTNVLRNKETQEEMKTKEGVVMVEHRFEKGDEFIPKYNAVIVDNKKVLVRGKEQEIENYYVKAEVRNNEKNEKSSEDGEFITLTPTQKKYLDRIKNDGVMINQEVFVAYEYEHEKYGLQVGIKLKSESVPAKTFKDFE